MKVVHDINKTGLDTNKRIYQCKTCGKLFNWDGNSSWYGSYKQWEEQPNKIKYFCSNECVPMALKKPKRVEKNKYGLSAETSIK